MFTKLAAGRRWEKISVAIMLIGIVFALTISFYFSHITWLPLDEAVHSSDMTLSYPFHVNYQGNYYIAIEAQRALKNETERNAKHKELECLLGIHNGYESTGECNAIPRAIDFHWQLLNAGQILQEGEYSNDISGAYTDASISAIFAYIAIKKHGNYELHLSQVKIANALLPNTPHIKFQLDNSYYVGHALDNLAGIVFGVLLAITGLSIFLFDWLRVRRLSKIT